jgi:hypothetical protein
MTSPQFTKKMFPSNKSYKKNVATPLLEECEDDTHSQNGDLGIL